MLIVFINIIVIEIYIEIVNIIVIEIVIEFIVSYFNLLLIKIKNVFYIKVNKIFWDFLYNWVNILFYSLKSIILKIC